MPKIVLVCTKYHNIYNISLIVVDNFKEKFKTQQIAIFNVKIIIIACELNTDTSTLKIYEFKKWK